MQKKLIRVGAEYAIDVRAYQSKSTPPEVYAKRATITALHAPRQSTYSGRSTVHDGVAVRLADGTETVIQTRSVLCLWDDAWEERLRRYGSYVEEREAKRAERTRREDVVTAAFRALGVKGFQSWRGGSFQLDLDEAEKLLALIEAPR